MLSSFARNSLRKSSKQLKWSNSTKRWWTTATTLTAQESNNKQIAYWLLGMSGLVAGMVTVGGITRLTRSGLSMTDWKLTGTLPPITKAEWEIEFERYKQYPEWQQVYTLTYNPNIVPRCTSISLIN